MITEIIQLFRGSFADILEGIDSNIRTAIDSVEHKIELTIRKFQRELLKLLLQGVFLLAGILLIIAGIIVFLLRFFAADLVLVAFGVVLLYVALILGWIRWR